MKLNKITKHPLIVILLFIFIYLIISIISDLSPEFYFKNNILTFMIFMITFISFFFISDLNIFKLNINKKDIYSIFNGFVFIMAFYITIVSLLSFIDITTVEGVTENRLENSQNKYILIFFVIFLAPVGEELFFRGLLQESIKQKLDYKWGIIITSLIFSLIHFNMFNGEYVAIILALFNILTVSLIIGFYYEKSENILVPIIIHSLNNSFSLAAIIILI